MAGISSVAAVGNGTSPTQFEAEYTARAAKMAKDAVDMEGDMALKLIESASVDAKVGQRLNMKI